MTKPKETEYVSTKEAARMMGVAESTIRYYLEQGWISGEKRGWGVTSAWKISVASIKYYLAHLPKSGK